VGDRTSATEASGRTLSWSYDGVNRLTNESVAQDPAGRNGSVSYTLDPVGNRLAAASTLPGVASSAATYSADDLLSTESYDLNGNVLSTGGKSFTYDSENPLVAMNRGAAGPQYEWPRTHQRKSVQGPSPGASDEPASLHK